MLDKHYAIILTIAIGVTCQSTFGATLNQSADTAMPRLLFRNGDTRHALFIDASEVIGEGGKIKTSAPLSHIAEMTLRDVLAQPVINGCISIDEVYYNYVNPPRRAGLDSAVAEADFVVVGKVTNRAYGFVEGVPGQLLRVSTISALKGLERPLAQYYIFIPVADFSVAGIHFCKTDVRYASPPEIGDRVFVFGQRDFTSEEYINTLGAAGYVRAFSDGSLLLPKALSVEGSRALHESDIRRLISSDQERRVSQ